MNFDISEIDFNEEDDFFNKLQSSCTQSTNNSDQETVSRNNKVILEKNVSQSSVKRSSSFSTFSPEIAVKRRFPGPAGLLPDEIISDSDILLSQNTTSAFNEVPWIEMSKDFQIGETYLFHKFNIAWIKKEANLNRLLDQKSPFLAAVIQTIDVNEVAGRSRKVVNVSLSDQTGTIQGTILHSLYESYKSELKMGSVIVLKQFGVLSCNCENCDNFHITVTLNNLATIYNTSGTKTVLSSISVAEVMREHSLAKERLENKINKKLSDKKQFNKADTDVKKTLEFNMPKSKITENISKSNSLKNVQLTNNNKQKVISIPVNIDTSTNSIKAEHNISDTEMWKSVLEDIDVDCLFGDF